MNAIVVDDEPLMVKYFVRTCAEITDLVIKETFNCADDALKYVRNNPQIDIAFLDVEMDDMSGVELAVKLREVSPEILIVFVSAYNYVRDFNRIGGDYYLEKPYDREILELMMEKLRLLAVRQKKNITIQMFGTFTVLKDGEPVPLRGRAKEILAFIAMHRGREISNQEICSTIWEKDIFDANGMSSYFHALRRLKTALQESGIENLLISSTRGQMLNTDIVDCDYYAWLDKNPNLSENFNGEFLSEYTWSESILAEMLQDRTSNSFQN